MGRNSDNFADRAMKSAKMAASGLAQRWWWMELWDRSVGRKVLFARTVTRDSFKVPAGRVGHIAPPFLDDEGRAVLAVKLQSPPPGSEPYEGEVHWREGLNILDIEEDLELL